ncbi:MAG: hypothetical protein WA793_11795 [Sphingorhabdus sp.]|uniref:hypothetical protein n=1 Tax=Sphingorhabdus sp. TaxID=1902408 RepID=UPI003CBB3186
MAGISDGRDKDTYRIVNSIMKPMLNRQGYRSLAEFEHEFESQQEKAVRNKRTILS